MTSPRFEDVPGSPRGKRGRFAAVATLVALALLALPASAAAITTTWTGDTDTDWATASNWDNGVPTASDTAVINNTSSNNPTVSTAGQAASAVTLSGSKQLHIVTGGGLTVGGQVTAPAGTQVSVSGGDLKFGTLLVDNAAGLSATGGSLTGTLSATAATTLTNAGSTYGGPVPTDGVTLGSNVSVLQTAGVNMTASHFLNIGSHLYTLSGTSITQSGAGGPPTITVASGGTLRHSGNTGGLVQPQVNTSGTLEDASSSGLGLRLLSNAISNANQLGGTLRTTSTGIIDLGGLSGDTYTVKSGGLTVDNTSGVVRYKSPTGVDLNLNSQTVTMLNGSFTFDGTGGGTMSGTGTFSATPITGGSFLINDGDFAAGANVTIPSGTTANVTGNTDWSNTFNFNVNGTLLLSGTNITASAGSPKINVSSTGLLRHTGLNGLVEPAVDSSGVIEDQSASGGVLNLEKTVGVVNLLGGTLRTIGADAVIQLGTEVQRIKAGGATFDTSSGGTIRTANSADLQLNGQTLTLVGSSLDHNSGAISGTGTIAGAGTLALQGGDFAGGGAMTVNAPVIQTSPTDVGGAGSELRIGGTWVSDEDITYSGIAGTFVNVLSAGTLRHTGGPASTVSAPLTVAGLVDQNGGSNWTFDGATTVDNSGTINVDAARLDLNTLTNRSGTTLTGGTYTTRGRLRIPGAVNTLNANVGLNGSGSLRKTTDDSLALAGLTTIGSSGSLTFSNGHTETTGSPLTVNGTLGGDGTVVSNVINNGTVSPGTSPGTLDVTGNYTQGAAGKLNIQVNGTTAGAFDLLNVDGDVTLDGELAMLPSSGYAGSAQPGQSVSFLRYTGTRSGTFSSTTVTPPLNGGTSFVITYDDSGQRVVATVSDSFTFGLLVKHPSRGTATQTVKVTGPGKLKLFGPDVETRRDTAIAAGKVKLPIHATGSAEDQLNQTGHVTVKINVTYTPEAGPAITKSKFVKLIKS